MVALHDVWPRKGMGVFLGQWHMNKQKSADTVGRNYKTTKIGRASWKSPPKKRFLLANKKPGQTCLKTNLLTASVLCDWSMATIFKNVQICWQDKVKLNRRIINLYAENAVQYDCADINYWNGESNKIKRLKYPVFKHMQTKINWPKSSTMYHKKIS